MSSLAARASRTMTLDEWASLPDDVAGELVDDVLVEDEMPTNAHELAVMWLAVQLGSWVLPRGGSLFASERKLAVGPRRGRKPDLSVSLPGSPKPRASASLERTPPDLVVEVISPRPRDARRDRVEKADDYAAVGVRWYWLVDLRLRTLEILELGGDGRYVRSAAASGGRVAAPGCPGLELDLDALWNTLDTALDSDR